MFESIALTGALIFNVVALAILWYAFLETRRAAEIMDETDQLLEEIKEHGQEK